METRSSADAAIVRHAVILCHPDPASLNHAIADAYCTAVRGLGHDVILRDLYAMNFDPVLKADERPTGGAFKISLDVENELAQLRKCDVFVLIYPIWFGTPPAMMKGYVERVLGSGIDPKSMQQRSPTSFLAGKRMVSFTTSAMSAPWLNEQGEWMSLRYLFDRYLTNAFGMLPDQHVHFGGIVPGIDQRWVDQHLYDVAQQARHICATLAAERHQTAALGEKRIRHSA
jgi:NAD(P)H dehydrogenase (quinone)